MARILFITPYYPPDLGPSAPLVSSLCERLAEENHTVSVIATIPHYPSGITSPQYRGKLWHRCIRKNVEVWHVWVPSGNRNNLIHRLFVFAIYQIMTTLVGLRLKYEAVIITNPAIETGFSLAVLCWLRKKPAIFCVWDLYPEIGIELGLFRDPLTIKIVQGLEDFCFQHAAAIQVLAKTFLPRVIQRVHRSKTVIYIPPWIDTQNLYPVARNNEFSREHGLDNDFVVMYAGNLGFSQNLESILLLAQKLRTEKWLRFVFVGDGPMKQTLKQQVNLLNLENVIFIPYQPQDRLAEVLSTADIAIVSVQKGAAQHLIPSKTFSLMACGKPILACVEEGCDLYDLIRETQTGICVQPDDISSLAEAITRLRSDINKRTLFGQNGRDYVQEYYSSQAAAKQFEILILRVSNGFVC